MWISHDLIRPFNRKAKNNDDQLDSSNKKTYPEIIEFQAKKLREKNNLNWMEFCRRTLPVGLEDDEDMVYDSEYTSCARIDAIHFSRHGKSHIKVCRVCNEWGPQTKLMRLHPMPDKDQPRVPCLCNRPRVPPEKIPPSIEERLHTIEAHLKIFETTPPPENIFDRLSFIEDRMFYLEGIDPEKYISHGLIIPEHKITQFANYLKECKEKHAFSFFTPKEYFLKVDCKEAKRRNKAYGIYLQRKKAKRKHVQFFGRLPLDDDEMDLVDENYYSCARTTGINYEPIPFVRLAGNGKPDDHVCNSNLLEDALTISRKAIPLKEGTPIPPVIYQRIKSIEDRILKLEEISPEIFTHLDKINKADSKVDVG